MSQQDGTTDPIEQAKDKVKEGVERLQEAVYPKVEDVRGRLESVEVSTRVNVVQVVTCLATVGLLWTSRRHLKFVKKCVKNMDDNMTNAQEIIKQCKETGQTFEFYPGVGLWVN